MSTEALKRFCTGFGLALVLMVLGSGCSPSSTSPGQPTYSYMSNNFFQIYSLLRRGNILPTKLSELGDPINSNLFSSEDPNLFICPGTGSRVGPMSKIEEWTDYIYAGQPGADYLINVAILISPPENHGGKEGYVLFSGGFVSRLPASDVRRLITNPFCMATNETPDNIASARQVTIMSMPKRLRPYYPPGTFFSNLATNNP
ncbi:MAG: hypothetical protein ACREDQ_06830 [Limisphaerales bacterium]